MEVVVAGSGRNEVAMKQQGSRPRIPPVEEPDEATSKTLAQTLVSTSDRPLAIFRTLAHHPRLLKRFNVLGGLFMAHGELPARERELVVLRVAWRSHAEYEWSQHVIIARQAGIDDVTIAAVADEGSALWTRAERDLFGFVDELLDTADVGDAMWDAQRERWTDAQLIELVMLVGFYRMAAGFLNVLGVQPEARLPGWPADSHGLEAHP
jgi:alkylhydroperoxidase family enzyme